MVFGKAMCIGYEPRQLLGHELANIKDLQNLKNTLEMNEELKKKIFLQQRLNRSFGSQIYREKEVNEANKTTNAPHTVSNGYSFQAPIHLQLSTTQPQNNEAQAKAMKLGYLFNLMTYYYYMLLHEY
ncbi:hypothetical protein CFP56_043962 [Quercus suber]|uniref:Uncharacterized protein n=1 Tax=Quercus suber TaxID=58331 RepID=A0AAW0IQZ9_QUESU